MAKRITATLFFLFSSSMVYCSGTLVGFSYDARTNASSLRETVTFLRKNMVAPSQIRVFVSESRVLESLCNVGLSLDLYVTGKNIENLQRSKSSAVSWIKNLTTTLLPCFNITSIVVSSESVAENQLHLLLPTLNSLHSALATLKLDRQLKLSTMFSLSFLENLYAAHRVSDINRIINFIRKTQSFIMIETEIRGELSLGDQLLRSMIKSAASAITVLPQNDLPLILNVKNSAFPSATEIAEFTEKLMILVNDQVQIKSRISGLFAEISPLQDFEKKELDREEEQMFPASHRELFNKKKLIFPTKKARHEIVNIPPPPPTVTVYPFTAPIITPTTPITNPVTTPVTVPSTTPVTVPPPATVPITNPVTTPVPVTNPVTTPITSPVTYPMPPPVSTPLSPPFTAPVTTPVTTPITTPVVSPITLAPPTVPVMTPVAVPPPAVTTPVTPLTPTTPLITGQSWCVAKTGALDSALQVALDYACGIGGADCSPIQQNGGCYNPNTLRDHASYAFNSYYQKSPVPSSCDFGGTATLVTTSPSSGTCSYPSASSNLSVLNTSNPASSTIFGSEPPSVNRATYMLFNFPIWFVPLTTLITAKQLQFINI